ncbi:CRISPR-associated protein Cas4 [Paenibacillus kobensis]|uniref:CRISPR-associated protein Cas4 n=1 Tax=Paenibacillus kobensis TaxID=59841 RepID=UPI000FD846B6|nr:CRISPR-associated protein Cas4 [Paenibacillus kobensis]
MVVNEDDDYLMLSGIQHYQFCKRQWALIHIEQQWADNVRTIEGDYLHNKADQPFLREKRGDKLIVRAMPVKSESLQISGICDVVEFVRSEDGVVINGADDKYTPYPVEYKRGKPKKQDEDVMQLTAQAICLEEMLLCNVDVGFIYYHEIRHRIEVQLTADLKYRVRTIFAEMLDLYNRRHTPRVKSSPACRSCSLQPICLPELMNKRTVRSYVEGKINE